MPSLESIFIKEFNRGIRMGSTVRDIFKVPLPEECKNWSVSGSELFGVSGIGDEAGLFKGLNKSIVKKVPKNTVPMKRKIDLVTRDFVRDANGRYVYEDVKIPSGSMVVISDKNLNLPYKYSKEDIGFGYIDFISVGSTKEYLYYIPKVHIYKINQTALALSVKNMKNFNGMGYLTWNFGTIFLHVIPYSPSRNYIGSRVLKTGYSLNFSTEVRKIVDFWEANKIIPRIQLSYTEDRGNLVLKETVRGYEEYNPIDELSIGERLILGEDVENSDSKSEE